MKNLPLILALLCLLWSSAARTADISAGTTAGPEDTDYLALVDKAMKDPATADWSTLRTAYTKTSFYKPYNGMTLWPEFEEAGKTAILTKTPDNIKAFQDRQKQQYANFKSHLISMSLARTFKPDFIDGAQEQKALEGIADSIVASGDGSTPEKAFKIVTQEEEDLVIGTYFNSKIKAHQEAVLNNHHFEVITYEDPKVKKGNPRAIFNIDAPYAQAAAAQNISGFK